MDKADLTVVICCNKKDYFFAKICVASVRYYYPDIAIELVKDLGNGNFTSKTMERIFDVKSIDLGVKKMGWSGAKFHYLYKMSVGKKVLLLDADIVFIGPFLERLKHLYKENDYVVSEEKNEDPYSDFAKSTYFDTRRIEKKYPEYKYPGYFFNAGQLFVTVGSIPNEELGRYFDQNKFPFWRDQKLFPLVDQSVYNYLLPTLARQGKIKLATDNFMIWSRSDYARDISLENIASKCIDGGVIHWAGDLRMPYLQKMTRGDILKFFEDYYYRHIPLGFAKQFAPKVYSFIYFYMKKGYRFMKKIIR